jgi:hypothetical protein
MINHIWTVLCSRSIIDSETNNITLFEVLEQLTLAGPPLAREIAIPLHFEVVSLWSRARDDQPSRGRARLLLITPSGTVVKNQEYDIDLSVYSRSRTRVRVIGLPVPEAGHHQFCVQLRVEEETEWRDVAKIPLQIVLQTSGAGNGSLNG